MYTLPERLTHRTWVREVNTGFALYSICFSVYWWLLSLMQVSCAEDLRKPRHIVCRGLGRSWRAQRRFPLHTDCFKGFQGSPRRLVTAHQPPEESEGWGTLVAAALFLCRLVLNDPFYPDWPCNSFGSGGLSFYSPSLSHRCATLRIIQIAVCNRWQS